VEFRTLTKALGDAITPALQLAHGKQFIEGASASQNYGSSTSQYCWKLEADMMNLCFESDLLLDRV
jgi:hypothetical protein